MSARGFQNLLAMTLVDSKLEAMLLRASPQAFEGFDLSESEVAQLRSIHAGSLQEFALNAHSLFYGEDLSAEMAPLVVEVFPQIGSAA